MLSAARNLRHLIREYPAWTNKSRGIHLTRPIWCVVQTIDSQVMSEWGMSSGLSGLIDEEEMSGLFEEAQIKREQQRSLRGMFLREEEGEGAEGQTRPGKNNRYLGQYLAWKESHSSFPNPQLPQRPQVKNQKMEVLKARKEQTKNQFLPSCIRQKYSSEESQTEDKVTPMRSKEGRQYQQLMITKLEPLEIQFRPKVIELLPRPFQQIAKEPLSQYHPFKQLGPNSYQHLVQHPPRSEIPYSDGIVRSDSQQQERAVISHLQPVVQKQHPPATQPVPDHLTRAKDLGVEEATVMQTKTTHNLNTQNLKSILKEVITKGDQKTIQSLSRQHKLKVFDILYNIH